MKCKECKNADICLDHREEKWLFGCTSGEPDRRVVTNADRIRNMPDEELAKFLARCDCLETPYCPLPIHCHEEVRNHETCAKAFLRYLQSESEVEKDA